MQPPYSTRLLWFFVPFALFTAAVSARADCPLPSDPTRPVSVCEDFNRADGPVNNGWSWWMREVAQSSFVQISGEKLLTFGATGSGAGIYRALPTGYPVKFAFDFRTQSPPGGGWVLFFNAPDVNFRTNSGFTTGELSFNHNAGQRNIYRTYWNGSGMVNEPELPGPVGTLRNYPTAGFAHIEGEVNADYSAVISIRYNDGQTPDPVVITLPPLPDALKSRLGSNLVLGNRSGLQGPHFFDNFEILASSPQARDLTPPVTQIRFSSAPFIGTGGTAFFPSSVTATLSATDPGDNAAGVGTIGVRLHSSVFSYPSGFQVYAGSFTIADVVQGIEYQSTDKVGNPEANKIYSLAVDNTAPVSTLQFDAIPLLDGTLQVSTATPFQVTAVDVPGTTGAASGVKDRWSSVDNASFVPSTGPFYLQASSNSFHTIRYFSRDNVLNSEVIKSTTVFVRVTASDTTPPITQLQFSTAPYVSGGTRFISSATAIRLIATDPGADATGIATSEYLLHPSTGPNFLRYGSSFTLAGGSYSIDFRSRDNAGNLEATKSEFFRVDAAAPVSQLVFVSSINTQGITEVSTSTLFLISAIDPVFSNVASGLKDRWVQVDSAPITPYAAPFTIQAASNSFHTLRFFSRDNVLNYEVVKTTTVFVRVSSGIAGNTDTTPPVTQLTFSTAPYVNAFNTRFISTSTLVGIAVGDLGDGASGVAFSEYRVSPATSSIFQRYVTPFTLSSGSRRVDYRSRDNAGNLETLKSDALRVDGAAPVSSLSFGSLPLTSTTPIEINAVDPSVDAVASGLKDRWVKIDGSAFALSTGPFSIQSPSSGFHTISFYSRDNVLNQEVVQSSTIFVTGSVIAPPDAGTLIGPLSGTVTYGRGIGCQGEPLNSNPVFAHGSVAVSRTGNLLTITVKLENGDPQQSYSIEVFEAAPTCSESDNQARTESSLTTDSTGNGQAQVVLTLPRRTPGFATLGDGVGMERVVVVLDNSNSTRSGDRFGAGAIPFEPTGRDLNPPTTELHFSSAPFMSAPGTRFISSSTFISLTAVDVGAGPGQVYWDVGAIEYRLHPSVNAEFQNYVSTFTLSNGSWGIDYRSRDRGGNQEVTQTLALRVDGVPPVSQLVIPSSGVTPSTPIELSATDPTLGNANSGVKDRWVKIDGGAFTSVKGNFFIPTSSSGFHTVSYYSRDNVLNQEVVRSTSVFVRTGLSGLTLPSQVKSDSSSRTSSEVATPLTATPESLYNTRDFTSRTAAAPPSTDFVLRKTFVFPNPARGGVFPTFHFEVGMADEVLLRIYDVAGRQLKEVSLTQTPVLIDSGAGAELAYEYVWDAPIPSGVYFFTAKAKKSGMNDIHFKGKFAVVR